MCGEHSNMLFPSHFSLVCTVGELTLYQYTLGILKLQLCPQTIAKPFYCDDVITCLQAERAFRCVFLGKR